MPAAPTNEPLQTRSPRKAMAMNGIRIFETLEQAKAAGFVVFDRLPDGYLVRKDTGSQFALAIVKLTRDREPSKN